jgi:hypothetical protein
MLSPQPGRFLSNEALAAQSGKARKSARLGEGIIRYRIAFQHQQSCIEWIVRSAIHR